MAQSRFVRMLFGVLIVFMSIGPASLLIQRNLGNVDLVHGLFSDDKRSLVQAIRWFEKSNGSDNLTFAQLALINPAMQDYASLIRDWQNPQRGRIARVAIANYARQQAFKSNLSGQSADERAWRILGVEVDPQNLQARQELVIWLASVQGDLQESITQYEQLILARPPTWQDYARLIALNSKIGNTIRVDYWHKRLVNEFPDLTMFTDLKNPYGQTALAEAYAALGLMNDALNVGEQALAVHDWDWGHYLIAGYYRQLNHLDQAERHYLAAITRSKTDSLTSRYRLDLADLYHEEGKRDLAIARLCQVVKSPNPENAATIAQAQSDLMNLAGNISVCKDQKP